MSEDKQPFLVWLVMIVLDIVVALMFAASVFFGILSILDGSNPLRTAALLATASFILAMILLE